MKNIVCYRFLTHMFNQWLIVEMFLKHLDKSLRTVFLKDNRLFVLQRCNFRTYLARKPFSSQRNP